MVGDRSIDQRISDLRNAYKNYSKKYGSKAFNLTRFENRLYDVLKNRINLGIFVEAEEEALQQLYEQIAEKRDKELLSEREDSFTNKVNLMIEEYDERIKKYTYIDFHPEAEAELKYLYGAISLFYNDMFPNLEKIFGYRVLGMNVIKEFSLFYNFFDYYVRGTTTGYSRRIEDHIIKIKYYSTQDVDLDYRNMLLETASFFNKLKVFIEAQIDKFSDIHEYVTSKKILFGREDFDYYSYLKEIIAWINAFLYDFRLESLI